MFNFIKKLRQKPIKTKNELMGNYKYGSMGSCRQLTFEDYINESKKEVTDNGNT